MTDTQPNEAEVVPEHEPPEPTPEPPNEPSHEGAQAEPDEGEGNGA